MTQLIKVYTPVKRVPTMIGKSQNGQKLPFGPYTIPQVAGGIILLVSTAACSMALPTNPAVTFLVGVAVTVVTVFLLGLVPFTGIRISSRVLWVGRLLVFRAPVSASGMPVDSESVRHSLFIEESVVVVLPDNASRRAGSGDARSAGGWAAVRGSGSETRER
ncbi:hypothetical protein NN3_18180 [Nocardia neocaledoniensis NBRC 108232]|uniref:Uncharacterized protein n=1 Tax=Nocardia neocaledoniensis TaxID=236511 RepID=A0A317N659_9NOCA|nr:hypothetical protein [Nocardia neocaledoniensis]PWV70459.1 hypothetical protein DFR69_113173 [Nocardia neocaledoniensis]GEM30811.1 hypothetical protein NN3_18180 [Nocardia neocaledoniensis NBRC 108232]